jgi:hypothetical protein
MSFNNNDCFVQAMCAKFPRLTRSIEDMAESRDLHEKPHLLEAYLVAKLNFINAKETLLEAPLEEDEAAEADFRLADEALIAAAKALYP